MAFAIALGVFGPVAALLIGYVALLAYVRLR